jgi:MAX-binding protein
VGNGNLILNPIQLLAPQLRVIQSNGLATIELSPNGNFWNRKIFFFLSLKLNFYPISVAQQTHHRSNPQNHQLITTPMTTSVSGQQLHKLLVSGTTTTANGSASHAGNGGGVVFTSELARLPGGAELNILPAGTNGATIYRGGSGLAILNNGGIGFKGKIHKSWTKTK